MRFLALLLAGILAGCGIQPTGVVDAGEPATGVASSGQVYLVGPDRQVRAATRAGLGTGDPQAAIEVLLLGPDQSERAAGLTTALPAGLALVSLRFSGGLVAVTVEGDPVRFSDLAVAQITCTVLGALGTRGTEKVPGVIVAGAGGPPTAAPGCPAL